MKRENDINMVEIRGSCFNLWILMDSSVDVW